VFAATVPRATTTLPGEGSASAPPLQDSALLNGLPPSSHLPAANGAAPVRGPPPEIHTVITQPWYHKPLAKTIGKYTLGLATFTAVFIGLNELWSHRSQIFGREREE
jgi:hypothetical protein